MEPSMLEISEQLLAKLSNPKNFEKIGRKTLAGAAFIDMPPEESEALSHNQQPSELIKLERGINGGDENSLALDGPKTIQNLTVDFTASEFSEKQKSLLDIPYTELMKEFDQNLKEVCNKRQFKCAISRRLNQVRNLIKKERNPYDHIKQEPVENSEPSDDHHAPHFQWKDES